MELTNKDVFDYMLNCGYWASTRANPSGSVKNWVKLGRGLGLLADQAYDNAHIRVNEEEDPIARIEGRVNWLGKMKSFLLEAASQEAPKKLSLEEAIQMIDSKAVASGLKKVRVLVECLYACQGDKKEAISLYEEMQEDENSRKSRGFHGQSPKYDRWRHR